MVGPGKIACAVLDNPPTAREKAVNTDTMGRTFTDLGDGTRIDITVEFISRRPIECDGQRVYRLLVADRTGTRFTVLATPDSHSPVGLKTGARHRISGLLGATQPDPGSDAPAECPHCGGRLRTGGTVDAVDPAVASAAVELDLDEAFGIVDQRTTIRRVRDDEDVVDDWSPMREDSPVSPPDYVCGSCQRHVPEHELRRSPPGDHSADFDGQMMANESPAQASPSLESPETLGLAAGGAKDVTNCRENVADGYTPQPEAISDEGLFYDYHFETGERGASDALFAPRFAGAVSEHPITGATERYLSVGLDSTLSVEAFERPRLDLVAVLDVSGSMESSFDAYYYDEHGHKRAAETDAEKTTASKTKLDAATESLCALTEQLHEEDRLGVILFNHRAHVAKPLRDVGTTDMPAIRRHVREIAAGGSTNLADGFEAAADMLVTATPDPQVERRVVFMTDMMPNTGVTGESELTGLFADAAAEGIHTTFVGMGLDANAALADTLSGIRGANHYFVHSAAEFERRLGDEFDYMVTPLVYDLDLTLDADGYEIAAVHGVPGREGPTEQLMRVGTLFPSAKEDGEARGGVVLVRLERTRPDADLELVASWTERGGGEHTERATVTLPEEAESFAHQGVRKAVALARYARELRAWAEEIHARADSATGVDDWLLPDQRGQHERESVPLVVPEEYAERFDRLRRYLAGEMDVVNDPALEQELTLLDTLCRHAPAPSTDVTE
ncbi:MAG: Ca-activated chloride channel family protein [Halobacteriales archaeon]